MDKNRNFTRVNPREKANIIGILLWTWTIKFFKSGYKKTLEPTNLYNPLESDKSSVLGDRLEREWKEELKKSKEDNTEPSLLKAILLCFWWEYLQLVLLQTFNEVVLKLGTPMLIGELLHYFKDESPGAFTYATMFAAGICVATAVQTVTVSQSVYGALHTGGKVRIAVCSLIYRKALRLRTTALGETSPGKIINLIANDVNRFEMVSLVIHFIVSAPLSVLIVGLVLYNKVGDPGLLGIVIVLIIIMIQSYAGKMTAVARRSTAEKTDERIGLMDEVISGMRVIKIYAWEKPFYTMVALVRKMEIKIFRKGSFIRGVHMTINLFTTRIAVYCTVMGILFSGRTLSAETIFVFSAHFDVIANTVAAMFFRNIVDFAACIVAVRRLQDILMYDEYQTVEDAVATTNGDTRHELKQPAPLTNGDVRDICEETHNSLPLVTINSAAIARISDANDTLTLHQFVNIGVSVRNLTVKWCQNSVDYTLENVSVDIDRGKLYIVIGAVGSGKSSLVSAILGEMLICGGRIDVTGELSYASQEAWLCGSTIRQNILFGQPYNRQRYQRVIRACALLSDFRQLPQGDLTVVGECNSGLLESQRARINLARSVYRQADVYIFDDPLSAVDTQISRHLFEQCIQRYLVDKTRILVTHQLQYIKEANAILLVEHGKVTKFTSYVELLAERAEYAGLLAMDRTPEKGDNSSAKKSTLKRQLSVSSIRSFINVSDVDGEDSENPETTYELEASSKGVVAGSICKKYFRAGGSWCLNVIVAVFFLLTQLVVIMHDLLVPAIVDYEEKRYALYLIGRNDSSDDDNYPIEPAYDYLYPYTGVVFAIFVVGIIRSFLFAGFTVGAAGRLHDRAFGAIMRAGASFFESNSSGRILNRFSKDMGIIDEFLPRSLFEAVQMVLGIVGNVVVVCTVNPLFTVPLAVSAFVFYWIRKVYLRTSKSVKRMEGALQSPMFTHFNVTFSGLSTIRACGAENMLKSEFDQFQDAHSSAWYMFIASNAAFAFSLDIFCLIFTVIVMFTLLFIAGYAPSSVGLAATSVFSITGMLQWALRLSAEVTNRLVSVERVLEYSQLPPEDNLYNRGLVEKRSKNVEVECELTELLTPTPKIWPPEGCIRFRQVSMTYADGGPSVLKQLDFVLQPGEKVGVVGRTASGKSSLISVLLRLAKFQGVIEIDGVDTGSIHLEDLRRNISVIPQDPVLFLGTLRKNLDPFGEFSDDELLTALEEVELKDAVVNNGVGLESRVFDRGANYSVGQRQLVCLARAILRNNRVLLLDEAMANIDRRTDKLIQRTIRTKFANCTILTVARRLNTIMDSDRVLVMEEGCLVEFDRPHVLLQNESGQFASLVKDVSGAIYHQLSKVAEESFLQKSQEIL